MHEHERLVKSGKLGDVFSLSLRKLYGGPVTAFEALIVNLHLLALELWRKSADIYDHVNISKHLRIESLCAGALCSSDYRSIMLIAFSLAILSRICCESRYLTALCIYDILSSDLCLDAFQNGSRLARDTIIITPHHE